MSPSHARMPLRAANAATMRTESQNPEFRIQNPEGRRSPRYAFLVALCLLLAADCSLIVRAQDELAPPPPIARQQKSDEIETIRVDTELVDLNVSVFSRDRLHPVGELQQKDFAVLENDRPEEISFFASASSPFDMVLLLDMSGSSKLDLVRKSARRFVEAARPTDRIGIITFTDLPHVVSPLTTDRKQLIESIKKMEKPFGGTNFWDALRFVLKTFFDTKDTSRRQAVVVMTDGVDNALPDVQGPGSTTSFEHLLEIVRASDAIVLPIYLDTEREVAKKYHVPATAYALARRQLAQLAVESGSLLYQARKLEDLKGVYEQVINDLGTVYSIGYRPTNRQHDGSWRNVSIRLVARPDLAARTKRGYYAK
jgi:VWFA-related protein